MSKPLAVPAFPSVSLLPICQSLSQNLKVVRLAIAALLLVLPASAAHAQEQAAQEQQGFSASDLQALRSASTGIVRDISATVGLNSGVRNTGPAPLLATPTNVDASELLLNVARLQRQLRGLVEREQRDGLALRYTDYVFEQAPRIQLFTPEDNLRFGPTPGTAPMHKEMMGIVTPRWVHKGALDGY